MRKTFTALAVASLSFLGAVGSAQAQVNLKNYVQCRSTELVQFQGTLVDAAIATPELSTLTNLVVAANLVGALSGPGPFTVFAHQCGLRQGAGPAAQPDRQ